MKMFDAKDKDVKAMFWIYFFITFSLILLIIIDGFNPFWTERQLTSVGSLILGLTAIAIFFHAAIVWEKDIRERDKDTTGLINVNGKPRKVKK